MRLLLSSLLLLAVSASHADEPVNKPTFQAGTQLELHQVNGFNDKEMDRWTLTFIGMENGLYRFDGKGADGKPFTVYRDENFQPFRWLDKSTGSKEVREFYRWPLTVGSTHDFEVGTDHGAIYKMNVTVAARETVTTPAGTFDSFRLEFKGSWHYKGNSGRRQATDWYAPQVGWTVKSEYRDFLSNGKPDNWTREELLAYRPAP